MIIKKYSLTYNVIVFPDYLWYKKDTFAHREGAIWSVSWFWDVCKKKIGSQTEKNSKLNDYGKGKDRIYLNDVPLGIHNSVSSGH